MATINFDCPHCGQNLDAPIRMAGWSLDCPACGQKIKVPVPDGALAGAPQDTSRSEEKASTGVMGNIGGDKEATVRIEVPEEYRRPPPSERIVKIKRPH